ncbi:MAG: enoyl-CoA hydratase [Gammaproteobacteria bacterium]|jgi:enoyl-CoA hydratase|nr:enoyl-CoA hydratase [Gammaproteobacteria bacterium]NCF83049.1 enoyl-CoA hydratase [Pseudomonadota bacterium]
MKYENIHTSVRDAVAIVTLNRPKVLNALSHDMMTELADAVDGFEADDAIGVILLTGNEKAFAAGADIAEMVEKTSVDMYMSDHFARNWERISKCRKPIIASVAGHALGGGCELAMMCDIIICADNARFGQPEVKLGVLPGIGGTQRLIRAVGKAKAMDMCLSGRTMDAREAERAGLVSRVYAADVLEVEAMKLAAEIAGMSRPALYMIKEAINRAYETTLSEGLHFERRLFHAAFAMQDQGEGMRAFLEKRAPEWTHS